MIDNLFKKPDKYYLLILFLIIALVLDIFATGFRTAVFAIAGIGASPTLFRTLFTLRKHKVMTDTFNTFALIAAFIILLPTSFHY